LSDTLAIKNGLKQRDALLSLLLTIVENMQNKECSSKAEGVEIEGYTSASGLCCC